MQQSSQTTDKVAQLADIAIAFKGVPVLHDVSLNISRGEFVSLIGRSGCGKSTLLRVIAELLVPDSGTVWTTGKQALGFQDARLVPWLKVWDNVTLGLPGSAKERRELADAALEQVCLADHADAWPGSLSGGQAQRVSLARALVRKPSLLLLDEPFGALDALTRLDMQDLLASLQAEYGWATLMVTHDIAEAVRLSDRVLVLDNGEIGHDMTIDRSSLDDEGRPLAHTRLEDELRGFLRGA